jgi:hypothetical protein
VGVGAAAYPQADQREHDTTAEQMLRRRPFADAPEVREAVAGPDPTAARPLAEQVPRHRHRLRRGWA